MKKLLLCLGALALAACSTTATVPTIPTTSPAPLAKTIVDDTALSAAWQAFDAALDAIDIYKSVKPSFKGTPQAIKIANAIDKTTLFLTAAENAAAAGSATDYKVALANAKAALAELRTALQEK